MPEKSKTDQTEVKTEAPSEAKAEAPAESKGSRKSDLKSLRQDKPVDVTKPDNPLGAGTDHAIFHPACEYIQRVPSAASYHAPAICPNCGGGGVVVLDRDEQRTTLAFQDALRKVTV